MSVFSCLGVNYRTAPVSIREKFAVPQRKQAEICAALASLPAVEECVLLSTCNRTEVYFWAQAPEQAAQAILHHFLGATQEKEITTCFYRYEHIEALTHLATVAAGLDSMVIGETEIFGQLKDAYRTAGLSGALTGKSHKIFQRVFTIGKKVRSSTHVTEGPTSVGAASVQLAQRILGDLSGAHILIVGAGDVARSTAQSLCSRGAKSIFVANRSYDRAVELAARVGGSVIRFTEWIPWLENVDIVIVSTAAPVYVVSPEALEQARQKRAGKPLFLIDLSVPRNIDPACGEVEGVTLYDIDTLQTIAERTKLQRRTALDEGLRMIEEWSREQESDLLNKPAEALDIQNIQKNRIFFEQDANE